MLHGLLERLGSLGVRTLEGLRAWSRLVPEVVRRKRHLAGGLPHAPGAHLFRDGREQVLYVGTSGDLRSRRVGSYFTAAETRRRTAVMVTATGRVEVVRCATSLQAAVTELRLLDEHPRPATDRRSVRPRQASRLALTTEPFPRLVATRARADRVRGPPPRRR